MIEFSVVSALKALYQEIQVFKMYILLIIFMLRFQKLLCLDESEDKI